MLSHQVIRNRKRQTGYTDHRKKTMPEQILALLATHPSARWYWRVIADCLGQHTQRQRWGVTSTLKNMTADGRLVRVRRGFYGLPPQEEPHAEI